MGKIKSRRHKYHLAAKKVEQREQDAAANSQSGIDNVQQSLPLPTPTFNPFAGLKIDPASLNIPPPEEWDRKTVVSIHKEITKGKNKKEKAKMRKELLLRKLEATRELELALKSKKQRERTVITKDLQPLLDSLPTVDLIHHEVTEKTKKSQMKGRGDSATRVPKDRNSMKTGRKQKEMLKDIDMFKKVLENEHFKANPAETMLNHLTLFVQKEYQGKDKRDKK